jgi:alanyl-tRNA synthetase
MTLIADVERLVGAMYPGGPEGTGISYRVLADHARSVTFLLLDGVYPSNEGRGFVLRRILRRAVRHAWLLGRREPTLVHLVPTVVSLMREAYPELEAAHGRIMEVVQREEENFYSTIDAGLARLEQVRESGAKRIGGEEAFKLFDTFGFPIDLTELIAGEWGISVDIEGFDRAMQEQRERSRAARGTTAAGGGKVTFGGEAGEQHFVGYDATVADTTVLVRQSAGEQAQLVLRDNPFYAGGGGQVPDHGTVTGDGWVLHVDDVVRDDQKRAVLTGRLEGALPPEGATAHASVDESRRRDIERNHSATHLAHMALRRALGDHVRQQGSLVEPGRLRFDFSHHAPIAPAQLEEIEGAVNELVLANAATDIRELPLARALELGAMAFFADKYGDVVRVVQIGDSIELCGGTHVRSAGQVGLFRFVSQGGVAAGVRRIEAVTGHGAYAAVRQLEQRIASLAETLRAQPDQVERKLEALVAERDKLLTRLEEATKGGGAVGAKELEAGPARLFVQPTVVEDRAQLGALADEFRQQRKSGSILALVNPTVPTAISFAVTDDLVKSGKDANALMKLFTARFSGRGGGRPTFASGSVGEGSAEAIVVAELPAMIRDWLGA